jgi:hypothetical protein
LVESSAKDKGSCSQVQAAILAVVFMAFRKTNAEVLKHLYRVGIMRQGCLVAVGKRQDFKHTNIEEIYMHEMQEVGTVL